MRINHVSLMLFATLALCDVACSKSPAAKESPESENIENFNVRQTVKTASKSYLCEGEEAVFADSLKIYSSVKISVEWPEELGGKDIKPLQDSLLKAINNNPAASIDETLASSLQKPEGSDTFKMTPVDSIPSSSPAMVYSRITDASVVTFNTSYIVYEISNYCYTGGAHGMTESHYLNYDLDSAKVITFENAFIPGSNDKLLDAIKTALMEKYSVTELDGLAKRGIFTDQLFVTHNMYLQGFEIIFHYNPYDIGPYAMGSIDARVPYYAVEGLLTPDVKALLTKSSF